MSIVVKHHGCDDVILVFDVELWGLYRLGVSFLRSSYVLSLVVCLGVLLCLVANCLLVISSYKILLVILMRFIL